MADGADSGVCSGQLDAEFHPSWRRFFFPGFRNRHAQGFAAEREHVFTGAVTQEAVVPDALEAVGQDVEEETPDELRSG